MTQAASAPIALYTHALRQALRGRRLIGLSLVALAPAALTLALTFLAGPAPSTAEVEPIFYIVGLGLVVPILALILGIGVIRSELEDGTVVHLVTSPVPRVTIILARLAAAITATALLGAVAVTLPYPLLGDIAADPWIGSLQLTLLAALVYTPLFALLGTATKRGLLVGILYIVAWEGAVASTPLIFRQWTVAFYLRSIGIQEQLVQGFLASEFLAGVAASTATSVLILGVFAALASAGAAAWFSFQEIAGSESE